MSHIDLGEPDLDRAADQGAGRGAAWTAVAGSPPRFVGDRMATDIARYLRNALVSGAFPPGQRLSPGALAEELGVSSMPVREALMALTSEGLVVSIPRRGFRVAQIQARDLSDAFRVHAMIAGLLAAEAAKTASPELVRQLEEVQREITLADAAPDDSRRSERVEELNFRFHRLLNTATDAPRLQWFMRTAAQFIPRHFYDEVPGSRDTTLGDHPLIIDAVARRDADTARRLMEAHILAGGEKVLQKLTRTGFFAQVETDN